MKIDPLVLKPHQARWREPSVAENQLADAIERAFAQGLWTLEQLVDSLNQEGLADPDGRAWTLDSFQQHIKTLSQGESP